MRVLVAGGSGFIGRALCRELVAQKYEVVLLSRFRPGGASVVADVESRAWNPDNPTGTWDTVLDDVDAVINLCGESVAAGRWSRKVKEKILSSRINSTRVLLDGIRRKSRKPKVFINASAVGYYGPRGDGTVDEQVGPGYGFLSSICQKWETETARAEKLGMRTVRLRIGIVLGKEGGVLKKMILPFKLCLGGPLGTGEQWMSWISMADMTAMILYLLKENKCKGAINGTAPHPVTNQEFTMTLARALHRPAFLPAPAFALKFLLGEMAQELMLSGQRVIPKAAMDAGFKFKHATLSQALKSILP